MAARRSLARLTLLGASITAVTLLGAAGPADAFCGFFVSGGGAKLFNNASLVVLLRDGTRTVLSMQNNYQGPPEKFALVVPVPVVLQKDDVKTLPRAVFDRMDTLAAPRLVEYWEQDPCPDQAPRYDTFGAGAKRMPSKPAEMPSPKADAPPPVRILAQFTVGEYEIVILGADDSTALDGWLRKEGYQIPEGAEPQLRPYVQSGMKFFVAKVDPTKVKFENGQAMLSPLRFHYESEQFNLPVRLGLMNSGGKQDLIVHVLSDQRYEVANYDNIAIPTNLDVNPGAKKDFASFYASLFDRTLEKNPGAVVTEYAWAAAQCDPCPGPPLQPADLAVLGGDTTRFKSPQGMVLTRLHARYGKETRGDDLVFRVAAPLRGGVEGLEPGAQVGPSGNGMGNQFQARYALRHPWTGAITCKNPERGNWGEPPPGVGYSPVTPALKTAFATRDPKTLDWLLSPMTKAKGLGGGDKLSSANPSVAFAVAPASGGAPAPSITTIPLPSPSAFVAAGSPSAPPVAPVASAPPLPQAAPSGGGCAGCAVSEPAGGGAVAAALGALIAGLRRRKKRAARG
jgi:MYXO-CTERM domain-containing protein